MRKGYLIAIAIAALSLSLCGWLFHSLKLADHLSASVLDLIPENDQDPQVQMARALVQSRQSRIVLLALETGGGADSATTTEAIVGTATEKSAKTDPATSTRTNAGADANSATAPALSEPAREAFLRTLSAGDTIEAAFDLGSQAFLGKTGEVFLRLRNPLLFPSYLQAQAQTLPAAADAASKALAAKAVATLDDFLGTAAALAYQPLIPRDPLLLVFSTFESWLKSSGEGLPKPQKNRMLVWATLKSGEPLQTQWPRVEQQLQTALAAAEQAQAAASRAPAAESLSAQASIPAQVNAIAPASTAALKLRLASVGPFFTANEQAIRREVAFFNIASISAVLLLCALLLRSPSVLFHTVAVLSVSLPFAWIITLLIFPRVPILGLVIGSVLVSVAIDYCLHVFLEGGHSRGEDGSVLRPLLLSCATTALAFAALTISPLPLLRQTGVFVAIGLVLTCALALFYKKYLGRYITARTRPALTIRHSLPWKTPAALAAVLLAIGLGRIHWSDSIEDLQYPLPQLRSEDEAVRGLFGASGKSVFISSGETFAQAREALAAFEASLPEGTELISLARWLPTPAQYAAAAAFIRRSPPFDGQLRSALDQAGYETELFAPFFEEWNHFAAVVRADDTPQAAASYEAFATQLADSLSGPLSSLIGVEDGRHLLISTASVPPQLRPQTPGTVKADTSGSLSDVFARYRHNALALSAGGILAVIVGGLLAYGLRRGIQVLLVPLGAGLCALGTLGYLHGSLNLFHVIGMFLGVCLALDYGAFALRNRAGASVPYSVCVAAATTLASFLLLTLSRIPAIHALGLTVALCIVYAFTLVVLLTIPAKSTPAAPTADH